MQTFGPIGRLGLWSAHNFKKVLISWVIVVGITGAFAPTVEHALTGAGWEAGGSPSVQARNILQKDFSGNTSTALEVVVYSKDQLVTSPGVESVINRTARLLKSSPDVSSVVLPRLGVSISRDGHTALVEGLAGAGPNTMVRAADALKGPISQLSNSSTTVRLTGASVLWSDFNAANRTAMLHSELFSWPVTLAILAIAFGSLVAAGLPLLLTIMGLMSTAGLLAVGTHIFPISIWALNFALMFALALGIDYALFVVVRFRAAHVGHGLPADEAAGVAMETAGKAVLLSGVTVLVSLSAVMLVPSPAFRSMALGIMLAVVFVLGATLTLLPAVMARLGKRINNLAVMPWVHSGEHRSPMFQKWGELLWRKPLLFAVPAVVILGALATPIIGLRTAMPSIKVVPPTASSRVGYELVQQGFGKGAPGTLQVLVPTSELARTISIMKAEPGLAFVAPVALDRAGTIELVDAIPSTGPSAPATGATIDRLRAALPSTVLIGGAAAENHDLQSLLSKDTPLVIAIILVLGFLLLLFALRAPLAALMGVITNLLATAASFGVARLIFQGGFAHSLLGFQPQGFLDAWGPIFFFAMIFAIAMDYTVFLLASAKEHWEHSGDAKEAMVGGIAHSGKVIVAAAAVMVAVFFTFAISGPLPPKEMGIILGVAVLLDAALVRLILLPVLLRLTGKAAWWLPGWGDRLLPRISFGHGGSSSPQNLDDPDDELEVLTGV